MDITTAYMFLIPKITYVTFHYQEGKLKKMPKLIDFLGYLFFYPSIIIGPVFEFDRYQ